MLLPIHSVPISNTHDVLLAHAGVGYGTNIPCLGGRQGREASEQKSRHTKKWTRLIGAFRGHNDHHGQIRRSHAFNLVESFPTHPRSVRLGEWFASWHVRDLTNFAPAGTFRRKMDYVPSIFSRPRTPPRTNLRAPCFQARRELSNAPSFGRIGRVLRLGGPSDVRAFL